jgi:hypothetical protein
VSMQRECLIYLATDSSWYIKLARKEYGELEDGDFDRFGPFNSVEAVYSELDLHSNPGGFMIDISGTRLPNRRRGSK